MTFSSVPAAVDAFSITMTATLAVDAVSSVEYWFQETTGHAGGSSSSWQSERTYIDTGLSPSTSYSYYVWARDAALNETAPSGTFSATTSAPSGTGTANCTTINATTLTTRVP